MRQLSILLLLIAPSIFSPRAARADGTATVMVDAASRFLAALDKTQLAKASFPFDSPERFNWHWIPRERKGLPLKEMTAEQRALTFGLMNTGLSTPGMIRATTIVSLEEQLHREEKGTGPVRDPDLYFVSVFGQPSADGEWGWRIEGHHLALNFTLKGGKVVGATPFMFGSNPALVKTGTRKGLRNLATLEDPINALVRSLSPEQVKLTVTAAVAPEVTTGPNSAQPPAMASEGISFDKLSDEQKGYLRQFLLAYAENFPAPIASELADLLKRDEASIHLAWQGPTDPTQPHALKVQGSTFFLDFNDTQNNTNHIHTFFRNRTGDFGVPVGH